MGRRYRLADDEEEEKTGHKFKWFGNNRLLCDVLEDMRRVATSDPAIPTIYRGLIEEAQVMANRMESALSDQRDLLKLNEEVSKARKAYKKLESEYKILESKVKSRPTTKQKKLSFSK